MGVRFPSATLLTIRSCAPNIEIKPLAVDIKGASFRMFRADNAEEIRVAHGVPGRLIGLAEKGGLGGAGSRRVSLNLEGALIVT